MGQAEGAAASAAAPTFEPFPKIPRLKGTHCVITEKIDGTNAQVFVTDDGRVFAGSRNRWLSPGKGTDNYGFADWVARNPQLADALGPGRHFGEWWGVGINRGYDLHERRFSLFDVRRHDGKDFAACGLPNVGTVPVLYEGEFTSEAVDEALSFLDLGSIGAPGFDRPEGVVIYHYATRSSFKVILDGEKPPKERRRRDDLLPEEAA